ncbi:MAG: DUF1569 domain-containing protein [Phycisphaerales bacterium]
MTTRSPINTAKVAGRRTLSFHRLEEVLADLARLETAHRAGSLKSIGNWTPGQIIGHLATWAEYTFTGAPISPPWVVRIFFKTFKKRAFLDKPMPAGCKIPHVPGGTLGIDEVPFDTALARYRAALVRLTTEAPTRPNNLLGPLTHDEWIRGTLRHAELHLSFMHP